VFNVEGPVRLALQASASAFKSSVVGASRAVAPSFNNADGRTVPRVRRLVDDDLEVRIDHLLLGADGARQDQRERAAADYGCET
jgi:hypothetical protein